VGLVIVAVGMASTRGSGGAVGESYHGGILCQFELAIWSICVKDDDSIYFVIEIVRFTSGYRHAVTTLHLHGTSLITPGDALSDTGKTMRKNMRKTIGA